MNVEDKKTAKQVLSQPECNCCECTQERHTAKAVLHKLGIRSCDPEFIRQSFSSEFIRQSQSQGGG